VELGTSCTAAPFQCCERRLYSPCHGWQHLLNMLSAVHRLIVVGCRRRMTFAIAASDHGTSHLQIKPSHCSIAHQSGDQWLSHLGGALLLAFVSLSSISAIARDRHPWLALRHVGGVVARSFGVTAGSFSAPSHRLEALERAYSRPGILIQVRLCGAVIVGA